MKALSLYEPWATLIAIGEKRFETRSWKTDYRGPLLICASKKRIPLSQWPPYTQVLNAFALHGLFTDDIHPGYALAVCDLTEVLKTDLLFVSNQEKLFGDFSPGRFAWKLENIRAFKNPPPVIGHQGLFEVDECYGRLDTYGPI